MLEAEREELGASILGVSPGDILIRPEYAATPRLLVESVRVHAGDNGLYLVVDGFRFRKDGPPGKRRDSVYLSLGARAG